MFNIPFIFIDEDMRERNEWIREWNAEQRAKKSKYVE